jgi:hypothetical protein
LGLKSKGRIQLLAYINDMNLLGDNIGTMKKNTETSNKVSLDVNEERTKHMLLSQHKNAGQKHDKNVAN